MVADRQRELHDACVLLRESVPLALKYLLQGGVELHDQWQFWHALIQMEKHVGVADLDNAQFDPELVEHIVELWEELEQNARAGGAGE